MTPINSTRPAFGASEAQSASQEQEERGPQTSDFSMLLAALCVQPAMTPQTEQQPSPESSGVAGDELAAAPSETLSLAGNGKALLDATNQATFDGPGSSDGFQLPGIAREASPSQQAMAVELAQSQIQQRQHFLSSNQEMALTSGEAMSIEIEPLETTRTVPDFAPWQTAPFRAYGFSPARQGFSSQITAVNILQAEGEAQLDQQGESPDSAVETGDAGFGEFSPGESLETATLKQGATTRAQTATLQSTLRVSTEDALKGSFQSGESRTGESQLPAATAQSPGATVSTVSAKDNLTTAQSIASQVAHVLTQAAGEVMRGRETRAIRLRLRPEELGEVQINLSTGQNGRLSAHITAEHEITRRAIATSLEQLREALGQAGVNIERLDVGLSYSQNSGAQTSSGSPSESANRAVAASAPTSPALAEVSGAGKTSEQDERLLSLRA